MGAAGFRTVWRPSSTSAAAGCEQARFEQEPLPLLKHGFTHFDLEITPIRARCHGLAAVMEGAETLWYNARQPARIGLPAPIATLFAFTR